MRKQIYISLCVFFCIGYGWAEPTPAPLRDLMDSAVQEDRADPILDETDPSQDSSEHAAISIPASGDYFILDNAGLGEQYELKLPDDLPESDIPLTVNDKVAYFISHFQTKGREVFARWLSRSERYLPMMKEVLRNEGLPEDLVYVAMIESGFSPHAYSSARAVGPWQFMSDTARGFSLRIDPWIDERRDPMKSTIAAAMYLKELYTLFDRDWYLAAAGYNAGENKILRAMNKYNSRDFWQLSQYSFLKRETKDYVPKLLAAAIIAKDPAKYGFADVAYLPPIEFDTVEIPRQTDLEVVAKLCDVSVDTIRQLNPELRLWCTPPDYPNYALKIPKGKRELFLDGYTRIPEDQLYTERILYTRYKVRRKDTLKSIARKFGTSTQVLAELNHVGKKTKLSGKTLIIPVDRKVTKAKAKSKEGRANSTTAKTGKKKFIKYYTVRKGDTLVTVAKRFNVSTSQLSSWNNLKGQALKPGKRIIVARYVENKGAMVSERDG